MSVITRLRCDRCGAETDAASNSQWGDIKAMRFGGPALLGTSVKADLCEPCADSMAAWFANPQQFRQLHDLAEATLLWFAAPWTSDHSRRWQALTDSAEEPTSKALCDAIRKALAHPEDAS